MMTKPRRSAAGVFATLALTSGVACAVAPEIIDRVVQPLRSNGRSVAAVPRSERATVVPASVDSSAHDDAATPGHPNGEQDPKRPSRLQFVSENAFGSGDGRAGNFSESSSTAKVTGTGAVAGYERRLDGSERAAEDSVPNRSGAAAPSLASSGLVELPPDLPPAMALALRSEPSSVAKGLNLPPQMTPPLEQSIVTAAEKSATLPASSTPSADTPALGVADKPQGAVNGTGDRAASEPAEIKAVTVTRIELQRIAGQTVVARLPIDPASERDLSEARTLLIDGLPAQASLSKGTRSGAQSWRLRANEAATAELAIATGAPPSFEITMSLAGTVADRSRDPARVTRVTYTIIEPSLPAMAGPEPVTSASGPSTPVPPAVEPPNAASAASEKSTVTAKPSSKAKKGDDDDDEEVKKPKYKTQPKPAVARQRSASKPESGDAESGPKSPFGLPASIFHSQN